MTRYTLTRLMTGIFIAQVAVRAATDVLVYAQPIRHWPEAIADALETTAHSDSFYMPAAIALMKHYHS